MADLKCLILCVSDFFRGNVVLTLRAFHVNIAKCRAATHFSSVNACESSIQKPNLIQFVSFNLVVCEQC